MRVDLEWYRPLNGHSIGGSGLEIVDLDLDGSLEIVVAAEGGGSWYLMKPGVQGYEQVFANLPYATDVGELLVAQVDSDPQLEIVVATAYWIYVYDGISYSLEAEYEAGDQYNRRIAVGNLDDDAAMEVALCGNWNTWVYELGSGVQQLELAGFGCNEIRIGEVDGSEGQEIILARSVQGYVFDGESGAIEWDNPAGFGEKIELVDSDGDGVQEIIAGYSGQGLTAWDGASRSVIWNYQSDDSGALSVVDLGEDGDYEVIYGTGGIELTALKARDGAMIWSENDVGTSGITRIAGGDVDGDGVYELFFGTGVGSSRADNLLAFDTEQLEVEWRSEDLFGPFYNFDHGDIDGDGRPEIVYSAFESNESFEGPSYFVHDARTKRIEFMSPEYGEGIYRGTWRMQAANVDADPQMELFLPVNNARDAEIRSIDGVSHALEWSIVTEGRFQYRNLAVEDIDGDGSREVIVVAGNDDIFQDFESHIYVYDALTGALEWKSIDLQPYFHTRETFEFLRVGDVDNDGVDEVVFGDYGLMVFDPVSREVDLWVPDAEMTALELADIDADGVLDIIIGTSLNRIKKVDAVSGEIFELAGPYIGQFFRGIQGLAVVQIVGDIQPDYVFTDSCDLYIVDGATLEADRVTDNLIFARICSDTGVSDSLRVADFDMDGRKEVWLNMGASGFVILELFNGIFADGFE